MSLGTGPGKISRTDQLMNIDSIDSRKLRAAARFLLMSEDMRALLTFLLQGFGTGYGVAGRLTDSEVGI